ncbi:hypothetical protein [Paenibacillus glacialis]|uniref:Uncharacterized protein n=1 Tax=Paenibacillus glacialis TaxID=494026 RepID=A0A168I5U5_9BACL|nr:hypothetical protein [Paenibacillus glacialis]OAB38901.1 hypothetical protein PGLA_19510 [Paenibacillus glacialis]
MAATYTNAKNDLAKSAELKNVLQYFNRYEDYSRSINASLNSVYGDHLPESAFKILNVMRGRLDKKQRSAIVEVHNDRGN